MIEYKEYTLFFYERKTMKKINKPASYFWNIESLWEKFYFPQKPKTKLSFLYDTSLDFTPSENFVFTDEKNKDYKGLKKYSCIKKGGKSIFLVDNHHRVLSPFLQIFQQTKTPLTIIHIDAHRDNAKFLHYETFKKEIEIVKKYFSHTSQNNTLSDEKIYTIFHQLENECRVSDYLDLALHIGLVAEVIEYTQLKEFKNFALPKTPFVLNLDIDIYGEEGSMVPTGIKTEIIAKFWNSAESVCIATSPAFIERRLGEKIIDIFTA